jgi:hypothetical protein
VETNPPNSVLNSELLPLVTLYYTFVVLAINL